MWKEKNILKVGPKRVLNYLRKQYMWEKFLFFPMFLFRIWVTVLWLLPAIYYKKIVDIISSFVDWQQAIFASHAISVLIIILFIKLWNVVAYRLSDFFLINMSLRIMRKVYLECFEYVHKHSYMFFSNNFTWSLIKKINKMIGAVDRITDIFVLELSAIVFNTIFITIVVGIQNIYFSIIFISWISIFTIVQYYFYKWNYPYEIRTNEQDSKVSGVLADTITNNFNIKTFSTLKREFGFFDEVVTKRKSLNYIRWMRAMVIWTATWLMMVAMEFLVFYYAIKLRSLDALSIWVFVLLQIYIFKLFDQLRGIWHIFRHIYRSFSESAEMIEILDTPHEVKDISDKELNVLSWKIEFENIQFSYSDGSQIFNWLDIRIKPWEKIAIVGESGSWKTSLIKLLFRFFDIQWWKILIDGQEISQVAQDSLRAQISMVPQDTILFHRSIRDNIAYWNPEASEQEIIAAAKMARCHDFIQKLSKWYDTLVWERWIKLSGWERQRVAIARAILENKRILVLDEATSSLDSESEYLIQEAMDEVMKNKTVIVVAHRLSTIMKMDKIIVMDKWKIIETWSHKELLSQKNSVYKKLRDIQSGWFLAQ